MKILLINNCHFRRGGSESVYFGTAELLIHAGHEIVFFSINDEHNIHTGAKEYFVKKGGRLARVRDYFFNPSAAKQLEKIILNEKPDIAHVHLFWGGISPSIFAVCQKYGIPLIHTVHDYRMVCPAYTLRNGRGEICEQCRVGHYLKCFMNRCSKGSALQSFIMSAEMYYRNKKWPPTKELDGIIYVSYFAKEKHEQLDARFAPIKSIVLYNFTTVGENYSSINNRKDYFLYYGRLSSEKGVGTLISTFSRHPELNLVVVGTGPVEADLKKHHYNNIQFMGYRTGDELYDLVRNAKFVCVPSEWYENNPMTIVESYSLGVPVIGANIGGIPEIIDDGSTGFLFESGNSEELERIVLKAASLTDDKIQRMSENAFDFYKVHFSKESYYSQLIGFYTEVMSQK